MSAAAQLRQDMAEGIEIARRSLPEDPVKAARMTAERIAAKVGVQREEVFCWMCGAALNPATARMDADGYYACPADDENDCMARTAEADDEEFTYEAARGRGDTGEV